MKKVTYQQVADALNISRVTVWKAVNDKPGIAPDTKRSILQKAVEMGYPISIMSDQESTNVVRLRRPKAIRTCSKELQRSRCSITTRNIHFLDEHYSPSGDSVCQARKSTDVRLSPSDLQ